MKLLLTMSVPFFPAHGGANTSNRLLFEAMVRQGHEVVVVTPMLGVPLLFNEEELLAQLHALGITPVVNTDALVFTMGGLQIHAVRASENLRRYLMQAIECFTPDFTVVSTEDPSQNLLDAALRTKRPVIYMARTTSFLPFGPQAYFPSEQRARLLEQVSAIVTVSEFVARYVEQWSGLRATALPISLFGAGPFPQFGSFERGFVTMINPCAVKGMAIFVGLARAFPDVQFAAVPTWGTTAADRAELGELPNVTQLDAVTDIDQIYRQSRVVLVPSLWAEAKSRTIVEAMLRGIPVLASDAGGNAEAIDCVIPVKVIERFTAQLDDNLLPVPVVPEQDLAPWIAALAPLVSDAAVYAERSQAARELAHRHIAALDSSPLETFLASQRQNPAAVAPGKMRAQQAAALGGKTLAAGDRIKDLSPEQQALLLQRLKKKTAERSPPAIAQVSREAPLPLSFAQQRLWFLAQLEPDSPFYNIPLALKIDGPLNVPVLERVLNEIVRRHETLRTTFHLVDEVPLQRIQQECVLHIPVTDLSHLDRDAAQIETDRLVLQASKRPFDLARDLPLRVSLIRLGDSLHVLTFTMHHIVADGWSAGVLIREVVSLYAAFQNGARSELPELPLQYADFAVWQRSWLSGDVLARQLDYWTQRLAGAPTLLELPTDFPRAAIQGFRGTRHKFELGPELSRRLRQFSQAKGVTLYMSLLAAFNVLLSRYAGSTDLCVGTAIANRNRAEIENLIGFFVNTLVMRSDLSGDPSFSELLKRTSDVAKGAYAHQDLPFEYLVEALSPARSLSHSALIQVFFVLEPPGRSLQLPGLSIERVGGDNQTSQFDLTLQLNDDDALTGEFHYSTDLFRADTIAGMVNHLKTVLRAAIDAPATRLSDLQLMSADEYRRLVLDWNATAQTFPVTSVHALFEAQAHATPDAVALVLGEQSLCYAELNARANQLAHVLLAKGVSVDGTVGLCFERSAEMIVGMLAVLKVGAAYVPLDPDYPIDRLHHIATEAGLQAVLGNAAAADTVQAIAGHLVIPRLVLDRDWPEIAHSSSADLPSRWHPDGLAYVIYTSGSTGRPKGVSMTQRALVNLLHWQTRDPARRAGRTLQLTSLNFDVSFQEIFAPLTTGGTLVIAPAELRGDMEALADLIRDAGVDRIFVPFVVLQHLTDVLVRRDLSAFRLKEVITAGEQLKFTGSVAAFFAAARDCRLANQYGPSEAHVVSEYLLPAGGNGQTALPPIGKPIANVQLYVLDHKLQATPAGIPGELHIGGVALARGYLRRPDLSAERFLPDPFSSQPGARMYRTGDKVRYLASGDIEFLGRLDDQVKIRGFRIELGEIETALHALDGVREAAVLAREDQPGDKRLVAYVTLKSGPAQPDAAALRAALAESLPEYMLPAAIVFLEVLPLTPNGKLDRRALPAPDYAAARHEYLAPRNATEAAIAEVWARVLTLDQIGIHDNFFDLGGHSLLATQVISRLRQRCNIELPLRALFEGPTVAQMAARVDAARVDPDNKGSAPILQAPRGGPLPLSFAQQRLWFLAQLEPDNPFYNMPGALHLTGELDVEALQRTLNEVVRRHEALRTCFVMAGDQPVQAILPEYVLRVELSDLSHLPVAEAQAQAQQLAQAEARQAFDLSREVPLRARLLRLAAQQHIMLFTMHHIASDGWSIGVLIREVAALYTAFVAGRPSPLAELPIQYADFAQWQRQWLSGEVLDTQLSFWQQQLAGAPALLELPTDYPRPAVQTYRGASYDFAIDAATSAALQQLGQRHGATLYMVLLAAFKVLLARYSGQTDIVVGSPIANRNRREIENLIGFFVNTLVLRSDLSDDPSFEQLLLRTRDVAMNAYAHQDLPFEHLVELLAPARSQSHSPFFQVMLVLQNAAIGNLELPGLALRMVDTQGHQSAKFDLTLFVTEQANGLAMSLQYNRDLFSAATAESMGSHFAYLLQDIVARPAARISSGLSLLHEHQRKALVAQWSAPRAVCAVACLHELFEAQADRTPDSVAVSCGAASLSYAELNARANQLAHVLRKDGLFPDQVVALCLDRSLDMLVAVLGVLKAGAAYLPLDPAYPAERLAFMLADARPAVVLTQSTLRDRLPPALTVLCLDSDWPAIAKADSRNLPSVTTPDNLAYVIYTSGSTGVPKGSLLTHANASRLFSATEDCFGFGPHDVWTLFHSYAFDFSVWEIWGALLYGGRLVVVPYLVSRAPEDFCELLIREGVTVLNQTPSAFRQVMAADARNGYAFPQLRYVIFGGEALDPKSLHGWFARHGENSPRLINMYGITETTVHVTFRPLSLRDSGGSPIGVPIPDLQTYLLDPFLNPLPVGVPGELYVGGAGLARAYLNRPELTAERFIANPFSTAPGARMYRTGDRARHLADGSLEYLGRIDQQIKLRGFRIELGEIEARLLEHPAVREAVVLLREDQPGDQRLVAYVCGEQSEALALRDYLVGKLPEYMVPAAVIAVASMPLNQNGKLDRKALPAPDYAADQNSFIAARNATEQRMVDIWAEVLQIDAVGIHDNFFALGGHSLLATQIIARVQQAFGQKLPLRALFDGPSVAQLAACLGAPAAPGGEASAISRAPRDQALALSFAQQRMWFFAELEPDSPFYNIPVALHLTGELDVEALQRTLNEVVRRHEALRTCFVMAGDQPVQAILPEYVLRVELSDLSHLPLAEAQAQAQQLAQAEARQAFDLSREVPLRARLLRLAAQQHIMLFTMHHIASDGWSIGVLIREVAALYTAFVAGRPSPLADLPIQYADFAQWQRQWLSGEVLDTQLSFWQQQLAGAPALLELPTDYPRPAVQTYRGASYDFAIDAATSAALQQLAQRHGATLYMVLLAAFKVLLARYSGQTDIVVGSPIANRNRREIENLIGFFVNTLVLRSDLSGDPSFEHLLLRTRDVAMNAYAHQDLPFELLIEALKPERNLSHAPLFQVAFSLQGALVSSLELPGLALQLLTSPSRTAKFDLSLVMIESPTGLTASLEYNTDLFAPDRAARMAAHFQTLLNAIAREPACRISGLPLLSPQEYTRTVHDWNASARSYPEACIHSLFEAQVARSPDAFALQFEGSSLSYAELDARANQLAHYLNAQGIGRDMLVGLCVERSAEMVIGLLAILKAGAAYVPLDPAYPAERLAYMLEDACPALLITQTDLLRPTWSSSVACFCIDRDWPLAAVQPRSSTRKIALAAQSAYVIYTSGSTGRPKGVQITHANAANFLYSMAEEPGLRAGDRLLAVTPMSFDIAALEIFLPLVTGARIVVASRETATDALRLNAALVACDINVMQATPATWRMLIDGGQCSGLAGLKVLCGGEALPLPLAQQLQQHGAQVWNMYGPTETTIWSSCHPVSIDAQRVPIGRPIANTRFYVLDASLNPVPIGVPGDLYIAGAGLARAYLNRPALTAERFIPDPFAALPGGRLYRTGDIARYAPDGSIEFLGRSDNQIKIRGFRIELGEIEAALAELAGVRECVVMARAGEGLDKRLVAYLVADGELTTASVRAQLAAVLPDYMLPSACVFLDAMPLTPNGKIDRARLPDADFGTLLEHQYVAPRNDMEALLVGIWSEILQLERVGVHDNFFDLGGHSLLATQAVSRVRQAAGLNLPLRMLFEAPTVAGLAERLSAAPDVANSQVAQALPLLPVSRDQNLPVSFPQQRLWFLAQMAPDNPAYNMPGALRLSGDLNLAVLERTLCELVRRHESLRTVFSMVDEQPVQIILPDPVLKLALTDLADLSAEAAQVEAGRLAQAEALRPFDLERELPIRASVIRLASTDHIVLFTLHHIVADGWSFGVLVRELAALYGAYAAGQPSPLAELPIQYADFAYWQRHWLAGEVLDEHVAYWREQLATAPQVLTLPTDFARPEVHSHHGSNHRFTLDAELTRKLRQLARKHDATLYMSLLATFNVLLARYADVTDVCVGTPVANRSRSEVESLIGFFVNTLVMRGDMAGDPDFAEILSRTRQVAMDAYAHQDLPFEYLVDLLNPQRSQRHTPLFQVFFASQNTVQGSALQAMQLPGLLLQPVSMESQESAKFDLSLYFTEQGDELKLHFEYNTDLFMAGTVAELADYFVAILSAVCADPARRLSSLELPAALASRVEVARQRERRRSLTVVASFTAELLEEPLRFWMDTLAWPSSIEFAGYDQVFQELLNPTSLLARNRDGVNLMLLRIEDWLRSYLESAAMFGASDEGVRGIIESNTSELIAALTDFASRAGAPTVVCCCPASQKMLGNAAYAAALSDSEKRLREAIESLAGVYLIGSDAVQHNYPVADYDDPFSDEAGHIPYTPQMFAALASQLARVIDWLQRAPTKLIALDCDNTLWKGVLGEVGVQGIELDPARRALQEFMRARHDEGMLLCLVSKNEAADVWEALDQRSDFPLQREHIVASRIGWGAKSASLQALAQELSLGLDSFIFVDDNPVECAEVMAHCPQVLSLQLPQDEAQIPAFLQHVWAFDQFKVTADARGRTGQYQQNQARQQARQSAGSFEAFMNGLQLQIRLLPIDASNIERVAELTQRTNQFNLSTRRRDVAEIRRLCDSGALQGLVVQVRDRFGDYGLSGVVFYQLEAGALVLDTWLLSCRVLGRGVEHRVLEQLAALAEAADCTHIEARYLATAKNKPVLNFLDAIGIGSRSEEGASIVYRMPVAAARHIQVVGDAMSPADEGNAGAAAELAPAGHALHARHLRVAVQLNTAAAVMAAMGASKPARCAAQAYTAPRNERESTLAALCAEVLKLDQVGVFDNFFALGGNSLKAIVFVSRIHQHFGADISLVSFFANPTVADLALLIDQAQGASYAVIPRLPEAAAYALSSAQSRLWTFWRLNPHSSAYHIAGVIDLSATVEIDLVRRAVMTISGRHASLRTTFAIVDDEPLQIIHAEIPIELVQLEANSAEEFAQMARAHALAPFDLEHGPLFRAAVLRAADGQQHLLWSMHHIISDGTSLDIMRREATSLITAYRSGASHALPALPIRYVDFAAWQNQALMADEHGSREFWHRQLDGELPVLDLPYDFPAAEQNHATGAAWRFSVPRDAADALGQLAAANQATLFMVLLSAFLTTLHRLTGQRDLLVTSPAAGREHPDTQALIGFFINTIVLRNRLDPAASFIDLLKQVQGNTLAALAHQGYPFERLVDELKVPRNLDRFPVSPLHFNLLNFAAPGETGDLQTAHRRLDQEMKFDLHLLVRESKQGLHFDCQYRTACFKPETVECLMQEFLRCLHAVTQDATQALARIDLFDVRRLSSSPGAQGLLRSPFLALRGPQPLVPQPHANVIEIFRPQVALRGSAPAALWRDQALTYAALARWADRVAATLSALGARQGDVVALFIEHPLAQLAATLGAMQAGCVFAALNPSHPPQRQRAMMAVAAPGWIMTEVACLERLQTVTAGQGGATPLLLVDEFPSVAAPLQSDLHILCDDALPAAVLPGADDPAYIYFTSGSTGEPKAILGRTGSLAHFVQWEIEALQLDAHSRVSQLTSVSFDAYLRNVFTALCSGGVLCIPPSMEIGAPTALADWLETSGITLLHCVPSVFRVLLDAPLQARRFPALRTILLAGEAVLPTELNKWIGLFGSRIEIINLYGATETTLVKFAYRVPAEGVAAEFVSIGQPMPGAQAILLKENLEPCARGEIGEIHIRTPYRSLGYYRQPALTQAVFIANPFGEEADDLLYKTGDLALLLPDGNYRFMGRRDAQIKLRGMRIELGEIEAALSTHPAVRQAVVLAPEDSEGGRQLLAYVVAEGAADKDSLRSHLAERLPEYMLPASYVLLDRLPLTPNGKIDRKALAAREVQDSYLAPRTATEAKLAELWAQVLKRERVGVQDDFFALGGHSLRATVLVSRIRASFSVDLPLRTLFDAPTIELVAQRIEAAQPVTLATAQPAIRRLPREARRLGQRDDTKTESTP